MARGLTITPATAKVLKAFLEDVNEPRYGFDLMRRTGLASGTLYPILTRLTKQGVLTREFEEIDPAQEGRPPRRVYRISAEGARIARLELAALSDEFRPPTAWRTRPSTGGGR